MEIEPKLSSNSHKSKDKDARKKPSKVIRGSVHTKKKGLGQKMMQNLISDDFDNIGSYVIADIVLPASKQLVDDIFMGGLDIMEDIFKKMVFGVTSKKKRSSYYNKTSHTSYNSMSGYNNHRSYNDKKSYNSHKARNISTKATHNFDDIILETRGDAEAVLSEMFDLLISYGFVSVGDLLDLVDITGSHTDQKWGWSELEGSKPIRVRDGYILKLPRTRQLD